MTAQHATPSDADLREAEEMVLSTFLRSEVMPVPRPQANAWPGDDEIWTGCITIGGGYSAVITVGCKPLFARQATALLVALPDGKIPDEVARDMLAELTNVVGGNIKSLYSMQTGNNCHLSLPVVAAGHVEVPGASRVSEAWYTYDQHLICVAVFEATEPVLRIDRLPVRGGRA